MTKTSPPRRSRESPRRLSPPHSATRRPSSPPSSSRPLALPSPSSASASSGRPQPSSNHPSPSRHQTPRSLPSSPSSPRHSQQQQLLPPSSSSRQQQQQQQQQGVGAPTPSPSRRLQQRTFSAGRQRDVQQLKEQQYAQQHNQQPSPSASGSTTSRQHSSSSPRTPLKKEQQQQQQQLQHKPIPAKLPSPSSKSSSSPSKRKQTMRQQQQATTTPSTPPPPPPLRETESITFSPTRSSSGGQSVDCLDTSLQMLRRSMKDNAKAYEYLLETAAVKAEQSGIIITGISGSGGGGNGGTPETSGGGNGASGNTNNGGGGATTSNSWLNILHTLRDQHEEEKSQWKKDLKEAKEKTKHFKHELRDNLTERLHWLESKVRNQMQTPTQTQQEQQHAQQEGASSMGLTRSSTSTMTQTSTEDETAGYHTAEGGTVVEVGEGGVLKDKEEGAIEVIFNTLSQEAVRQRIHELEDDLQATIHHHVNAQKEWARSLDEAAAVTANSTALSAHMQKLLQDVATDLRKTYHEELQAAEGRSLELQNDLRFALEKYQDDKATWQQETAKLKDDSRRLLSERKSYEAQLYEKEQKVVAAEDSVDDLKRQVELAQRQTSVAQKQVTRLQEKLAEQHRLAATGADRRNPDPPSPTRPGDFKEKYQKVVKERDTLQREAEETVSMLGDYQKQLEKERSIFANQQKAIEKKWQAETERKIKEFRDAQIAQFSKKPLSEVPHAEMERRYRDSVEKRNEMAARMRKVELQHAADKGSWKLQLEATLVEARNLSSEKAKLETALDQAKKSHEVETQIWHDRVKQITSEWNQKLHDLKTNHQNECIRLRVEISEVQAAKNGTEAAVIQNRHMLEQIKNQHRAELMDWKERLVGQNKQTIAEMDESHKKQIENLEKERGTMQKFIQDLEKQLTEMEKTHADEIAEWTEEIRGAVLEHESRMSELKEAHQTDAEEWKALILELQQQNDQLLADKEQQQEVNKTQLEENENLQEELQGWIQKTEQLQATIEELNRSHQDAISLLEDRIKKVEDSAAERLQLARQQHQEELETSCQQESAQHKEEIRQLEQSHEATIIQLQERHEEKTSEVEQKITELEMTLKEKDSTYESILAEWRDNHSTLKAEKEQLEAEKKTLEEAIQQLQAEREEVELELHDRADLFLEEKNRLEALLEEKNTFDGEWKEKAEKLEAKIKEMKKSHKETLQEWNSVANKLEKAREAHEKDKNEKEEQLAEWRSKAEKLESAIGMSANGLVEVSALHAGEIQDLKDKMKTLRVENGRQLELGRQAYEEEINQWKIRLESTQNEYKSKITVFKGEHSREAKRWRKELDAAEEKTRVIAEQTNILSATLEEINDAHSNAEKRWEADLARAMAESQLAQAERERVQAEKERVQAELFRLREDQEKLEVNMSMKTNEDGRREDHYSKLLAEKRRLEMEVSRLSSGEESSNRKTEKDDKTWQDLACAVEELRQDVVSVRETLLTSAKTEEVVQEAHFGEIRDSLEEIQNGLNDAVAELTLETEAMIENREHLKTMAVSLTQLKYFEQQERLLTDMGTLSESLKLLMDKENGEATVIRDKLRADLAGELHRKEVALAAIMAEIETVRTQLASERGLRERAEQEILTLNDQADAYGEELMRLQGINKGLEDTLKQAEIRMQSALMYGDGEQAFDENGEIKKVSTDDSSSPMLEEALLLAQNVKDLVDGKCGHEKETTVMEMLETLSDMMDQHDRGEVLSRGKSDAALGSNASIPIQVVEISSTPRGRSVECVTTSRRGGGFRFDSVPPERLIQLAEENDVPDEHDDDDDAPPSPVTSPPGKENHGIRKNSKLNLVVDQLYGRCQLLERERTELMEVTLDLLQSARNANAAELDAALSTARRKSAEELLKVREQNQEGMWRLYHKLCGNCQVGLIGNGGATGGGSGAAGDLSPCMSLQPSQAPNLIARQGSV